jgi:hypothetical protein
MQKDTTMKISKYSITLFVFFGLLLVGSGCEEKLNDPLENTIIAEETDYTQTDNMISPLIGMYAEFYSMGWEKLPLVSVRGDDVNKGGEGDQQPFGDTDMFNYDENYWMYNSVWQGFYQGVFTANSTIEEIEKYKKHADNKALADQYIAEAKVLRAWYLFQLSRVWGKIFITEASDPSGLFNAELSPKEEVMQYISDQMDQAVADLPDTHPNQRDEITGGVTQYTALAIEAQANLELEDYQGVADATSQIISSGLFSLHEDFYQLFKLEGKLNDENLLELQYSDFGSGSGEQRSHLFAFYGPQNWTPAVSGASSGWGFWEPTLEYIKFMLERGEQERLQTTVLFTLDGISELENEYGPLPDWISNETPSGDVIENGPRANFFSGKYYLPSNQLTPGRTGYGNNKNYPIIRYAEVLLMHAEALVQGANSSSISADQAVNLVRERAGLDPISNVTLDQVMDEKYAEMATEMGIRFYDMVRLERYEELNYHEGEAAFTEDKIFLPYPLNQQDLLPQLRNE